MQVDANLPKTLAHLERSRLDGLHFGGQLYVRHRGELVADLAFGEARVGEPMRPERRLLWLSSGKPVTAVAIARLWEAGKLDLDDPVASLIPEFGTRGKEVITIRHLLTHTAGIRTIDLGWPREPWKEILRRLYGKRVEPRWTPGLKAGYHRMSSWFVLGEIVQRLTGEEISRHLREAIFLPLGMENCWIGMPEVTAGSESDAVAPMFDTDQQPAVELPWTRGRFLTNPSPGASAVGPIRELGRFYEMLLGRGTLDGVTLISPQTVEAMTARQRVGLFDHTFRRALDWGLGFVLDSRHYGGETAVYGYGQHCSTRVFGHAGDRSSIAFADPEHDLVVALAVNGLPDVEAHRRRFACAITSIYEDLELGVA
jgi:CubicO group peptidase (beta-lactamase class C family)